MQTSFDSISHMHRLVLDGGLNPAELPDRYQQLCLEVERSCKESPDTILVNETNDRFDQERLTWLLVEAMGSSFWTRSNVSPLDIDLANVLVLIFEKEAKPRASLLAQKFQYLTMQICDWPYTRRQVQRSREQNTNETNLWVHPDCECLMIEDKVVDARLFELAFAFIRSGQREKALSLFEDVAQIWRFAILAGAVASGNDSSRVGDMFRLSVRILQKAPTSYTSPHESACMHVLCESGDPIWRMCPMECIWDYWWAGCVQYLAACKNRSRNSSVPVALNEIFDHVKKESEVNLHKWSLIERVQELICLNAISDCFTLLSSYIAETIRPNHEYTDAELHTSRFFIHLMIVLDLLLPDSLGTRWTEYDASLSAYIKLLLNQALLSTSFNTESTNRYFDSIATYVSFSKSKEHGIQMVIDAFTTLPNSCLVPFSRSIRNRCEIAEAALATYTDLLKSRVIYEVIEKPEIGIPNDVSERLILNLNILEGIANEIVLLDYSNAIVRMCLLANLRPPSEDATVVLKFQRHITLKANLSEYAECLRTERTVVKELLNMSRMVQMVEHDERHVNMIVGEVSKVIAGLVSEYKVAEFDDPKRKTQVELMKRLLLRMLMQSLIDLLEKEFPMELVKLVLDEVFVNDRLSDAIDQNTAVLLLDSVSRASALLMQRKHCPLMNTLT